MEGSIFLPDALPYRPTRWQRGSKTGYSSGTSITSTKPWRSSATFCSTYNVKISTYTAMVLVQCPRPSVRPKMLYDCLWRMAVATPDIQFPCQLAFGTHFAYPRRMARLSWPGWLVTRRVGRPGFDGPPRQPNSNSTCLDIGRTGVRILVRPYV